MCKEKKLRFSFRNKVTGTNANIASDDGAGGCRLHSKRGSGKATLRAALSPASLLLLFSLLNTVASWAANSLAEGSISRSSQLYINMLGVQRPSGFCELHGVCASCDGSHYLRVIL